MHEAVHYSNAQSPLIVPGAAGRARIRVRRPRPRQAFSEQGNSATSSPRTYLPAGRSENNAMLAVRR
jgi:hypothetical protein